MTDRDSRTRSRARAPGAEGDPPSRAVHHHGRRPGSVRDNRSDAEVHEGRRQTGRQQAHAGSRFKPLASGKAPPDRPAFQPYWGKPAVRNERGDRGNVGIIRSPVRASILPDFMRHGGKVVFFGRFVAVLWVLAAFLAGANRMPWPRFFVFRNEVRLEQEAERAIPGPLAVGSCTEVVIARGQVHTVGPD